MVRSALLLAPIIVPQALWVAARASRLPEANGARLGTVGEGAPLRLLVVGDSSAAGVGVDTQDDALAAKTAQALASSRKVAWRLIARSGATVASTLRHLAEAPADRFDVALTALGVNDAKNAVRRVAWQRNYAQLVDLLENRFAVRHVLASGLPPIDRFPVLPRPLRDVLGARARDFDDDLRTLAAMRRCVQHLPMDFAMDVSDMASDGFHPGARIYAAWGSAAGAAIANQFPVDKSDAPTSKMSDYNI